MTDRILTPLIAVGLGFLVWLYTRSRDQEVLDNFKLPVELHVAADQAEWYELEVHRASEVQVSFTGPPSRIRELRSMLQHGEIRAQRTIAVPEERLNDARYAEVLRIDAAEIPVPPGIHVVVNESQNRIPITMRRLMERRLEVRLEHTAGERLSQAIVEPRTVLVRGPKEVLERCETISTQLYQVPSLPGGTEPTSLPSPVRVPMITEMGGRAVRVTPATVSARFTLAPEQKEHELRDVPIHFLYPASFPYRPQFRSEREGRISLRIRGPATQERPMKDLVKAYVDLTEGQFVAGTQAEERIRIYLPPGFKLAQEPPRLPAFELVPHQPVKAVERLLPP